MKQYDPLRADRRDIEDKAFGLLYAMTNEEIANLRSHLKKLSKNGCSRADRILGVTRNVH